MATRATKAVRQAEMRGIVDGDFSPLLRIPSWGYICAEIQSEVLFFKQLAGVYNPGITPCQKRR